MSKDISGIRNILVVVASVLYAYVFMFTGIIQNNGIISNIIIALLFVAVFIFEVEDRAKRLK